MDEGVAIIVAATLALASIFITASQQRRLLRKQHTYRVLEKMNEWDTFETWIKHVVQLIESGQVPRYGDDNPLVESLDLLLNHYEFVSAAIICGDIDERLVAKVEKDRLTRVFLRFILYIEENRTARGTRAMWENLEFITYRWRIERPDGYENLLDRVRGRPPLGDFQAQRETIFVALKELSAKIDWPQPDQPSPSPTAAQ